MNVFLPTCGTGNSLVLATFGAAGEIMGFFYPHLDFAQNVREGMYGIHLHDDSEHPFLWCFADCFERSQSLQPGSNILVLSQIQVDGGRFVLYLWSRFAEPIAK